MLEFERVSETPLKIKIQHVLYNSGKSLLPTYLTPTIIEINP